MDSASLLVITLVMCGYACGQDNNTVMDNEVSNKIEIPPPRQDGVANMKYACSLTLERYNDTGEDNITKETKMRLAVVCCPGYTRDEKGICQPHCNGGCGDGFCEFPGICSCTDKCAFNTVDRRCACFEATCPGGCPANGSCIADNTCDCNFAFVKKSNWTSQYTNSTAECIPYCYPFCTNKLMSSSPEHCICNYTQVEDGSTFNKNGSLGEFANQTNSHQYLGHLFQSHGHPSFTAGLAGLALGAVVGHMIGSHGKSKNKYGKGGQVYGMPGGYNYGMPGNAHYGGGANYGHGYPGGYPNTGTNYGHGVPPNNQYGSNYGHSGANYGHGVPPNTNYGHGVPPNTNYGAGGTYGNTGQYPGTHYGQPAPPVPGQNPGGTYGNPAQYPGTHYGQPAPPVPGQNPGSVYGGAPGQTQPGTGVSHGNAGQPGWNVPGQNPQNVAQKTANTYGSAPGQPSGTNLGSGTSTGTGQRTNYGWNVPSGTNTGGSTGNTNYGWNVPSGTNTGANTGTGSKGTGTSSSGTSSWPWGSSNSGGGSSGQGTGSSGRGNSGGSSGRGSSGKKRGRKH